MTKDIVMCSDRIHSAYNPWARLPVPVSAAELDLWPSTNLLPFDNQQQLCGRVINPGIHIWLLSQRFVALLTSRAAGRLKHQSVIVVKSSFCPDCQTLQGLRFNLTMLTLTYWLLLDIYQLVCIQTLPLVIPPILSFLRTVCLLSCHLCSDYCSKKVKIWTTTFRGARGTTMSVTAVHSR